MVLGLEMPYYTCLLLAICCMQKMTQNRRGYQRGIRDDTDMISALLELVVRKYHIVTSGVSFPFLCPLKLVLQGEFLKVKKRK